MVASAMVWFAPRLIPEGWTAEAVLRVGMGAGLVLHRVFENAVGWILEPYRRHWGASLEARLRLLKLELYEKKGMILDPDADELRTRIVRGDVTSRKRKS